MQFKKIAIASVLMANIANAQYFNIGFGIDKVIPNLNGNASESLNRLMITDGSEPEAITDQLDNTMTWVDIKHPLPVLPNLKIEKTKLLIDSRRDTDQDLNFKYNGKDYSYNGHNIQETISDIVYTDFTPYYNILDESMWLTLNVGLTIREIEAEVKLNVEQYADEYGTEVLVNTLGDVKTVEKTYLPMAYLNTRIDIPDSNFTVEGTYRGVQYQDNSLNEFKIGIEYKTDCGPGARLGYQETYLESDSMDNYVIDMNLQTLYMGIFVRF